MDGISPTLSGVEGRNRVPFLPRALFRTPHTSFYDFLSQMGISPSGDAANLVQAFDTVVCLATFLQSWLFFDLLECFLELHFERTDFVADDMIEMNQAHAHGHFKTWRVRLSALSISQRFEKREHINRLLNFATQWCDTFEDAAGLYGETIESDIFDRVALSVRLLLSLLSLISKETFISLKSPWHENLATKAPFIFKGADHPLGRSIIEMDRRDAQKYFTSQPESILPLPLGDMDGGRATKLLLRCFVAQGWCPSRSRQLCQSYDYLYANYLATLDLKTFLSSRAPHDRCLPLGKCEAYRLQDTSWTAYPFRHVPLLDQRFHCQCEFMAIDKVKLHKIIKDGGIPIVSMAIDGDDLDLKVEKCTPSMTYTAISHVWSDGLGNPAANSVYQCQLIRLRNIMTQIYLPEHVPTRTSRELLPRVADLIRRLRLMNTRIAVSLQILTSARPGKPGSATVDDRIYFWLDTFCIPRSLEPAGGETNATVAGVAFNTRDEYEKDEAARERTLQHITPIYAGASNVLILDGVLEKSDALPVAGFSSARFAALVLSSNWMQRGWTFEEGCLAQNCAFRLKGKGYDMSTALQQSIKRTKWQDSPLDKATAHIQHGLPTILKQALMDEKRQLSLDDKLVRRHKLKKLFRVPQFVRTWNSLSDRSTTRPNDRLVLFANLLDFNIYSLKFFEKDQRLPALIQSCHELPLSLLYNTGPRLRVTNHPEMGWIPSDLSDSKLVVGATIRRKHSWWPWQRQVCFKIDVSNCEVNSIFFTKSFQSPIPQHIRRFSVQVDSPDQTVSRKLYIEAEQPEMFTFDTISSAQHGKITAHNSLDTCIVLDLSYNNVSTRGFVGRGARFNVATETKRELSLAFDSPLIAYTAEQWYRKFEGNCPMTHHYDMETISSRQTAVMKFDSALWHRKLARRPLLTQHPASGFTISLILLFVTFGVMLVSGIFIPNLVFGNMRPGTTDPFIKPYLIISWFLSIVVAFLPRKALAQFTYSRWLKTFEKGWAA